MQLLKTPMIYFVHWSFVREFFIAFISFLLRFSALEFSKEITAQIAAGIHPIKVICKIKQMIDVTILPLKKNDTKGKKIAINVISYWIMLLVKSRLTVSI
jgi:hypothetical protein